MLIAAQPKSDIVRVIIFTPLPMRSIPKVKISSHPINGQFVVACNLQPLSDHSFLGVAGRPRFALPLRTDAVQ